MKRYWTILSARFRVMLQYRTAAIAGLGTQVFWGFIRIMIFSAFYQAANVPQPISFVQLVTYIWLGQGLLRLLPWTPDFEVRDLIRSGDVVYELAKPLDLYGHWFMRSLALHGAPTVLRALPMFVLAMLFFGMKAPASFESGIAFLVSVVAALILAAAITTFITVTMMWTLAGDGIASIFGIAGWFFSGMVAPLPLLPPWLQQTMYLMPFRGIIDIPIRLYIGDLPAEKAAMYIGFQLGWAVVMIALGRWLLTRGTSRLIAQGG
jgi:ABC-2 type transport system permease protein